MAKSKKMNFRKKVKTGAENDKNRGGGYGYLKLPQGVNIFKPQEGRILFDIMPYLVTNAHHPDRDSEAGIAMKDEYWYKCAFKVHKNIGIDEEDVICPTTFGLPCPICEHQKALAKSGDASKEEIDAFRPQRRNLYAIIPLKNKDYEETIHLWDVSDFLFQRLLNDEIAEEEEYAGFPELEGGYSLKVRFEEKSFKSANYFQAQRIDFTPRKEDYEEDILEDVPNLDDCLTVLPYVELEAMLHGIEPEDMDDEDFDEPEEDEKPKPRRKKHVEVDDDDDEPEEEEKPKRRTRRIQEEDDDEPEEKPIRRKKPVKAEEEDDDPEEDDYHEVVEKPSRTGKSGRVARVSKKVEKDEEDDAEECPHGHEWGEADEHKQCAKCDLWEDCIEAKEE